MADGTNVGKINLQIDLSQDLQGQIDEVANKTATELKGAFEKGLNLDGLFNGIQSKFDSIMSNVNNALDSIQSKVKAITQSTSGWQMNAAPASGQAPQSSYKVPNVKIPSIPKINNITDLGMLKAQIDSITNSLNIVNAMIHQQQTALEELKVSYAAALNEAKRNTIEGQMLKAEQRINSLTATSDKLGFTLSALDDRFNELSNGADNTSDSVDRANGAMKRLDENTQRTSRSASAYNRTINQLGLSHTMFGRILDRMLVRMVVFNLVIRQIENFAKFLGDALMTNQQFATSLAQIKTNLEVAFMPIYQACLPALVSLMQTLARATTYIAVFINALMGTTYQSSAAAAKKLNNSIDSMKAAEKQAKKAGSAVKGIGDSAKEAVGALMGFDEINQLDIKAPKVPKVDTEVGDLALNLPVVAPPIDVSATTGAMEKVQKAAEKTREIIKTLLPVIAGVVAGFLTFKLIESIIGIIDRVGGSFSGLWAIIIKHPIAALIIALASLAAAFAVAYATNKDFRDKVNGIWDSIKQKCQTTLESVNGFIKSHEQVLNGLAYVGSAAAAALILSTGPIGVAAVAAGTAAMGIGLAFQKVIPSVNLCKGEISSATKKSISDFEELKTGIDEKLMALKATGTVITKETASSIEGSFNAMTNQINTGFENHKQQAIKELQDLSQKRGLMTSQEYEDAISKVNKKYTDEEKITNDGNAKIQAILDNAAQNHRSLTQSEYDEINRIKDTMQNQAVKSLTKNQEEQRVIFENIKNQHSIISAQEASEVVKNSKKATDGVISDAKEQYNKTVAEIIHQRDDVGSISAEQASHMIAKAQEERDGTIKAAQERHLQIVDEAKKQAGEHIEQIDWETGEVKTKWQVMKDDLIEKTKEMGTDLKAKFDDIKEAIPNKIKELKESAEQRWDEFKTNMIQGAKDMLNGIIAPINKFISWWNKLEFKVPSVKTPFGESKGFSIGVPHIRPIALARGGIIDQPTLAFMGEQNRKEAVIPLENTSFVETLASAVGSAVLQAMQFSRTGQNQPTRNDREIIINIDGKRLARVLLPYTNSEIQRMGYKPILRTV